MVKSILDCKPTRLHHTPSCCCLFLPAAVVLWCVLFCFGVAMGTPLSFNHVLEPSCRTEWKTGERHTTFKASACFLFILFCFVLNFFFFWEEMEEEENKDLVVMVLWVLNSQQASPFYFFLLSSKIQYPLPGVWLFGINLRPVDSFLPWGLIAIVEDALQSNKNTKDQHNSNLVRAAALCDRWHGLAPSLFSLWGEEVLCSALCLVHEERRTRKRRKRKKVRLGRKQS